jgi:CheY-like chemotaxis protein
VAVERGAEGARRAVTNAFGVETNTFGVIGMPLTAVYTNSKMAIEGSTASAIFAADQRCESRPQAGRRSYGLGLRGNSLERVGYRIDTEGGVGCRPSHPLPEAAVTSHFRTAMASLYASDGITPPRKPRVLLADDYLPLLIGLERLLRHECDIVGRATTVAEVLEAARNHRPDIVMLDLSLPDTNGIDACRRLRAAQPEVKIIVVTAMDDDRIRAAALEAGAADFVPKRMIDTRLLPAIREVWSQVG